jgi:hypothetical protein
MSAEVTVRISDNQTEKTLGFEVQLSASEPTLLENAIAHRLKPHIEALLEGFQQMADENDARDKAIQEAEQSRIILP